jgi:cysteinyl-tRNA synthetase
VQANAVPEPFELDVYVNKFFEALDMDLNISGAMGHLFDLVRISNKALDDEQLSAPRAAQLRKGWELINKVLGFERDAAPIPEAISVLAAKRQQARAERNWSLSDKLRDEIAALGWNIKDTPHGSKLTPR